MGHHDKTIQRGAFRNIPTGAAKKDNRVLHQAGRRGIGSVCRKRHHTDRGRQTPKEIYRDRIVRVVLQINKKKNKRDDIDEDWLGAALYGTDIATYLYYERFPSEEIAALFIMDLIKVENGVVRTTDAGYGVLRWESFLSKNTKKF